MKSIRIGLFAGACSMVAQLHGVQAAETKMEILYSFGGHDGMSPHASLTSMNGQLYGTTLLGGAHKGGAVFAFDPKNGIESLVYSFCSQKKCTDGASPTGALISANNLLYGVTQKGGTSGKGAVFSVDPKTGTAKVVYSLCSQQNCTDGQYPDASLINVNGTLYGTTQKGGAAGGGTVFSLDPNSGAEEVVYSFCSQQKCTDGKDPEADLINLNGVLFGTTRAGGNAKMGTVFSLDPASGTENVLYSFCSQKHCTDGAFPLSSLLNVNGTLYGTTYGGGTRGYYGTVFTLDPGTGSENVAYSFCSLGDCVDGQFPSASLINVNGTLYGTTAYGGTSNGGEMFSLAPGADTLNSVVPFCTQHLCTDGAVPETSMIDVNGTLYGTTRKGGEFNFGTIYAIKNP